MIATVYVIKQKQGFLTPHYFLGWTNDDVARFGDLDKAHQFGSMDSALDTADLIHKSLPGSPQPLTVVSKQSQMSRGMVMGSRKS